MVVHRLKALRDTTAQLVGELASVPIPAGTVLESREIVANGTPCLAYVVTYRGRQCLLPPTIGYVVVLA